MSEVPRRVRGIVCPSCGHELCRVIRTRRPAAGVRIRRRQCLACGRRFNTREVTILA
jgi:transcriptional regulator NrdR family protein